MIEASRAKHKFAVKRNSWPKTRGVAMNPVDHVSISWSLMITQDAANIVVSLMVVVIINISVKPQPSHGMLRKVKRRVSSLLEELVSYVVPRRQKISPTDESGHMGLRGAMKHSMMSVPGLLLLYLKIQRMILSSSPTTIGPSC